MTLRRRRARRYRLVAAVRSRTSRQMATKRGDADAPMPTRKCDACDSERDTQPHDTADHRRPGRVQSRHQALPVARRSALLVSLRHVHQSEQQSVAPASGRDRAPLL
jgi:hypothetical protein